MVARLGAAGAAVVVCGLACQQLIDLGEKPTLEEMADGGGGRTVEAGAAGTSSGSGTGGADDTGGTDSAGEAGATGDIPSGQICGVLGQLGPMCAACLETMCCAPAEACGQDEGCVGALDCLQLCYEETCVADCLAEYDNEKLDDFFSCNLENCAVACIVVGDCFRLADECCSQIENRATRAGCMNIAHSEDQTACQEAIDTSFVDSCAQASSE